LTFLVEKNYAHPTYRTQPLESTYLILCRASLHYAIKGPENPSTETILQLFDHVTEGTVADASQLVAHMSQLLAVCHTNVALPSDHRG